MFIRKVPCLLIPSKYTLMNFIIPSRHLTSVILQKGAQVVEHKKPSQADVENFSNLTGDFNSVHFGSQAIVHGVLLNGYVSAILGTKLPGPGYVVFEQSMSFPNPCRVGDDIEIVVEVVEARKIVSCKFICNSISQKVVVHQGTVKLLKFKGLE